MSSYLSDEEEELICPLCMEEIDIADRNFKPCVCGYQICRFCWNHILEDTNGKCPACRRQYSKETVEFTPIPQEELQSIKAKKRAKERERREQEQNARKHLSNVRVVQKNLVYVIGIPPKLATEETIRQHNYFGKYGKITKVVINKKYIILHKERVPILVFISHMPKKRMPLKQLLLWMVHHVKEELLTSYGTTKYCTNYLKGQQCQNPNCMYLHEPGEEADSYSKENDETLNQGKHNLKKELTSAKASFPYKEKTSFKVINSSSFNKDDNKEEGSALPSTASWAKLTKSSSSNSSLNKVANSKTKQESEKAYSSNSGQIKSKSESHKIPGSSSQQSLISSISNLSNNSSNISLNKALENTSSTSSINANSSTNNNKHVYNNSSDQEENTSKAKSSNSSINTPTTTTVTNENKTTDKDEKKTFNNQHKTQNVSQSKPTVQTTTTTNTSSQPSSNSNSQTSPNSNSKPRTFKIVYEDLYTGSSALSDNSNEDDVPPNAINNLQHKYEGPFNPFCEDPFHFTDEEIFTALAKLQQKLRLASIENYQQQLLSQTYNNGMLSPELTPENKLSRMMSANSNDISTSLNNIIKRKLQNNDDVRNLFNNQNNMYQNKVLSNSAAQSLPLGTADNWNEMNLQNHQYPQNIQSLNSLVMNNSGSMNGINDLGNLQNNILNNMNRTNSNIQMNNNTGNQYNSAASNYNNMQRLHNLQGINTNMNTNGNMNYVNSMISPELEYQNVQQQYQNYNFTPRQQQAFMNTNQHPSQQQQQQQLYQRMNNANNTNSQQLPGDFFGQMLHQKQNVQPHGQNSLMNIPFQDPAIMAVRMSGNGQPASPYDNAATQMSPLEYLNSFSQNKK
ncbi:hypothetical protein LY90DRAFT_509002 [Neocallimastix californiae]|uniref:RING-type domain-containing protein n=1 Tax=Neocallimastix californiae TaxID=1754190 RepID=A0A1Y2CKY5_9FUNG|nr:hypothetical protein LY90DRAFT_509002 [Neocallimastix californiae]|eukprot:ORY47514.1 hypothetical protein LY90DRAFT_509002 [Neocallimastix californiae]